MVAIELLDQIDAPNRYARFQLDARQVAERAEEVSVIIINERRSTRNIVVIELALGWVLQRPQYVAIDGRVAAELIERISDIAVAEEDELLGGRDATKSGTMQLLSPHDRRLLGQ